MENSYTNTFTIESIAFSNFCCTQKYIPFYLFAIQAQNHTRFSEYQSDFHIFVVTCTFLPHHDTTSTSLMRFSLILWIRILLKVLHITVFHHSEEFFIVNLPIFVNVHTRDYLFCFCLVERVCAAELRAKARDVSSLRAEVRRISSLIGFALAAILYITLDEI